MKKIFTNFSALCGIALLMLASCKKDDSNKVTISTANAKGALSANTTTIALNKDHMTDNAVTFNLTAPKFGFSAAVSNVIQISTSAAFVDSLTKETSLGIKDVSKTFTVLDFNNVLLSLKLSGGVATTVHARLKTQFTSSITAPTYSNEITLNATPFNLTSFLYTVGAFQGWDIKHQDSLLSATSNGIYIGVINFTAGNNQFLVVPVKGSYDNKYATTDAQNTTSSNVVIGGANNFYAPSIAGFYTVTLNLNTNKITFDATKNYYSVIGDGANGWDAGDDVDMKSANDGTGSWSITLALKSTGSIKIRKGHDWAIGYGIPKTGADGKTLASSDDDNIPVPVSGTYKITFLPTADDKTAAYTLVKQP
jgi:hypothetical protein